MEDYLEGLLWAIGELRSRLKPTKEEGLFLNLKGGALINMGGLIPPFLEAFI